MGKLSCKEAVIYGKGNFPAGDCGAFAGAEIV